MGAAQPFYLLGEDNFGFPRNALTQKFAFVGKSGSGKTYAVGRYVEQLSDRGAQFIIVDPVGNWWGIRLSKDGKEGGLSIPVLGGMHGDIPLHPAAGGTVGRFLAQHKISAIVDVSQFTQGQTRKFIADFSREFFEAKKRFISPVMVIWEESQIFVPQRVMPDQAVMVGNMELLIKIGRNYGVGTTLVGQRPQSINKDVLNQTECFICFQLSAPHERKAVAEWMNYSGVDEEATEQLAQIPRLKEGQCFVWSPSWLEIMRRVKFLPKRTFDFSRTPDLTDVPIDTAVVPLKLPEVALTELTKAMELAIADVVEKDVKILQRKIKELETELRSYRQRPAITSVQRIEVPIIAGEDISSLRVATSMLGENIIKLNQIGSGVEDSIRHLTAKLEAVTGSVHSPLISQPSLHIEEGIPLPRPVLDQSPVGSPRSRAARGRTGDLPTVKNDAGEDVRLSTGEIDMVVQLSARFPRGYTKVQLATLTGYKPSGGGFNNSLYKIKGLGLISKDNENYVATDKGRRSFGGKAQPIRNPEDMLALWASKLDRKPAVILKEAFRLRGKPMTKDQMANLPGVNMSPTAGGFNNYLYKLTGNMLLIKGFGGYRISDLFISSDT